MTKIKLDKMVDTFTSSIQQSVIASCTPPKLIWTNNNIALPPQYDSYWEKKIDFSNTCILQGQTLNRLTLNKQKRETYRQRINTLSIQENILRTGVTRIRGRKVLTQPINCFDRSWTRPDIDKESVFGHYLPSVLSSPEWLLPNTKMIYKNTHHHPFAYTLTL